MNIARWLYDAAMTWPNRPALYDGTVQVRDYQGVLQGVCDWADYLASEHGISAGDRVALFSKNVPQYLEVMHAVWWIGAVAVPINAKLHPKEVGWILKNSGAKAILTEKGDSLGGVLDGCAETSILQNPSAGGVVRAPRQSASDELAWLFYTSGTTGQPKGVMLSHGNLAQMALSYAIDVDAVQPGDHMTYLAPMSHGAGLYMFNQVRAAGAHVVPQSRGFDPIEIMSLAGALGNLTFFAAPTMIKRLVAAARDAGFDGTGIRTIIYGGGPMYDRDLDEARDQFGARLVQIYGQGESPMTITALSRELVADETHPRSAQRRSSVGRAQACITVSVRDPDGQDVAPRTIGEICVRGPTVMSGYWGNKAASRDTLKDGWLHTGDLGHLDEDGFLYLTDRLKDVIISGGTNIYPREVEDVLLKHPGVSDVSVIGEPEPDWGEQVVAIVVARPGEDLTVDKLDAWCRDHMAAFKRPKRYAFVPDLPKNSYGKILKTELRRMDGKRDDQRPD